jgi:hypothetical protein
MNIGLNVLGAVLITLSGLSLASPAPAQQKPSPMKIQVCRSKATMWESDVMTNDMKKLPYEDLEKRVKTMNDCALLEEPTSDEAGDDARVMFYYKSEQKLRLELFLTRHNLFTQFVSEDQAQTQAETEKP